MFTRREDVNAMNERRKNTPDTENPRDDELRDQGPANGHPAVGGGNGDQPAAGTPDTAAIDVVETLPVLPMKNSVVFPYVFSPLTVGRPASLAAVEAALVSEDKTVLLLTQKDPAVEDPQADDLYTVGTRAVIKKMARNDDVVQLLAQGLERVRVESLQVKDNYLTAQITAFKTMDDDDPTEREATRRAVLELVGRLLELAHPDRALQLQQMLAAAEEPIHLVFLVGSLLEIDFQKEQSLLEAATATEALRVLSDYLQHEVQVQELRHQITSKARSELSKEQREYMLRQQLQAIQEELGETSAEEAEIAELERTLDEAKLPDDVRKEADRELKRLERLPVHAPDYQLTRTYLELVAELPWRKSTPDAIDLNEARRVLDEDHFGLDEVKDRILEHLAVMLLNPESHSPILCFVGPPGVGKTSLGQSIARALGRNFERLSLGGLHDEAELRGHRRTYIGAMPGRVIQAVRRADVNNPLLMLDEVDKLGRDFRGDPASALLEILDPAQNNTFRDNYLDMPFDLSKVFFITTANTLDSIPRPLLDRMEVLRLPGYTDEEKIEIAHRYLMPRQFKDNGVAAELLHIPDDTLRSIISRYTREAGVRQLERSIGRLARKIAMRLARGDTEPVTVRPQDLPGLLGKKVHRPEESRDRLQPGEATGLAWTEAGGDVLFVETTLLPHGRGIRLTGQLGDVMKESAEAAQSYIWAHAEELGIEQKVFKQSGLHIHVPAGAVPKDGPSAGVAMVTALVSLLTKRPARADSAMTGEITLSGRVLPIGGVKEKVLAARAAGITRVVLPEANRDDLRDLPDNVHEDMEFVLVKTIEEALAATIGAPNRQPDLLAV